MTTTTDQKTIKIILSERAPVTINPADWPVIASASGHDGMVECQANTETDRRRQAWRRVHRRAACTSSSIPAIDDGSRASASSGRARRSLTSAMATCAPASARRCAKIMKTTTTLTIETIHDNLIHALAMEAAAAGDERMRLIALAALDASIAGDSAPRARQACVDAINAARAARAAEPMVRILSVDGSVTECTLASFFENNRLDEEEERALRAGDSVTLGGGASPLVRVELVS